MRQDGLTLIQLLIALALIGASLVFVLPSLQSWVRDQQRAVIAYELASGLRSARAEAILRQRDVLVQAIDGDWGLGWWMLLDENGQGAADPANPVLLERRSSGQVPVVGNTRLATRARFIPQGWPAHTGTAPGNGTLHVCAVGLAVSHWRVVIANSGRIRLESGAREEALCAPSDAMG